MKKLLLILAAMTCFVAIACLCGCSANKITTADTPPVSENENVNEADNDSNDFSAGEFYTVTYLDGETVVGEVCVPEGSLVSESSAPTKAGYEFAGWSLDGTPFDFSTPITSNVTLSAAYTPVVYTAVYKVNGNVVNTVSYTVESKNLCSPAVPERYGYVGEWEKVEMSGNVEINAVYTPTVFSAKFVINGNVVGETEFTVEDDYLSEPDLPYVPHYSAAWEAYEIAARDLTVNAIYTPITYFVTFVCDNEITSVPYSIIDCNVTEPELLQKDGYTVSWSSYSLDYTDITVNAQYTPIDYTITFIANGQVVETVIFNVENIYCGDLPPIPQRLGFESNWQDFEITLNDIVVTAEYTMTFKDEFTYSLSKDKTYYSVTGYNGKENYLVIPSEHNGIPVKVISDSAFIANTNITSVDICDGIEVIDDCAFMYCTNLKSVTLPESLITIGDDAFTGSGLTQIVIPENVQSVGVNAFRECYSLKTLTVEGNAELKDYSFSSCTALTSINFENKLEKIGAKAFFGCTALEEVYLPASLKEIEANAFAGCTALHLVEFETPSGWALNDNYCLIDIDEDDVSDGFNAARLLSSVYATYKWTRL